MKNKVKKQKFKKIARAHLIFTMIIFGLYLALSSVYGTEFIFSDIREKFSAFADEAIVITAKVLGPPIEPVVSGTAVCENGKISVNLDWAEDENSETFDIERDGSTLVMGLINSQYTDNNVSVASTYEYIVTARGVMDPGQAVSQVVSVTTLAECKIVLPPPIVNILTFNNKNVSSYVGDFKTTLKRPTFSGTTNIPNAIVRLELHSAIVIVAEVLANNAGYWEWSPLIDLSIGNHQLFISAQDPVDILRNSNTTFNFIVENVVEEDDSKKHDKNDKASNKTKNSAENKNVPVRNAEQKIPFGFALSLQNNSILQGDDLIAQIELQDLVGEYIGKEADIEYRIVNNKGIKVFDYTQKTNLTESMLTQDIQIPRYFKEGEYKLQANISAEKYNISREISFAILPVPFINLGGGTVVTYPEFLSKLGTIGLVMLISLIIWLLVFMREYWLYLHAWRHVTERSLDRLGLFGVKKRKGVSH